MHVFSYEIDLYNKYRIKKNVQTDFVKDAAFKRCLIYNITN